MRKTLITLAAATAVVAASTPVNAIEVGGLAYNRCDSSRGLLVDGGWYTDGLKALDNCRRSTDYGIKDVEKMVLLNDQCWRLRDVRAGITYRIEGGPRTFYVDNAEQWQVEVESKHGSTSSGYCSSADFAD